MNRERHHQLAWAAIYQLLNAYALGEQNGGSIHWTDLDLAHELALEAVGENSEDNPGETPPPDASTLARIRELAAFLVEIADPASGDYDLNFALAAACDLAALVERLDKQGLLARLVSRA